MKKLILTIVISGFLYLSFATCTPVVVYVHKKPPARKIIKVKTAKPFHNAVWISGHWQWKPAPGKYVWVKGNWAKPRKGKVWVKGHWAKKPRGWVYVSGHWK